MLSELKQRILDQTQSGFPVASRPYEVLAKQLGCSEDECYDALTELVSEHAIRRVGASFDSKKLGYVSALSAFAVEPEKLPVVADMVSACPNVTHNYGRADAYNLWFTLICPSKSHLRQTAKALAQQAGIADMLVLEASRLYKINVDFSRMQGRKKPTEPRAAESVECAPFDAGNPIDVAIVQWAQGDISQLGKRPFASGAEEVSAKGGCTLTEQQLVRRIQELKDCKAIRRFGSMVRHQQIGFAFNSMTVWQVEEELQDALGRAFAKSSFVSHCYARPAANTWPYTLYAMVHAQSQAELDSHIQKLSGIARQHAASEVPHKALTTTNEFKKVSMTYFKEERND